MSAPRHDEHLRPGLERFETHVRQTPWRVLAIGEAVVIAVLVVLLVMAVVS
ncbi:MAG: hypothetical protein FWD18_00390 [Micrococcales bacterium]|nr:hypothetical protein [Micrococcales bacterium]